MKKTQTAPVLKGNPLPRLLFTVVHQYPVRYLQQELYPSNVAVAYCETQHAKTPLDVASGSCYLV